MIKYVASIRFQHVHKCYSIKNAGINGRNCTWRLKAALHSSHQITIAFAKVILLHHIFLHEPLKVNLMKHNVTGFVSLIMVLLKHLSLDHYHVV